MQSCILQSKLLEQTCFMTTVNKFSEMQLQAELTGRRTRVCFIWIYTDQHTVRMGMRDTFSLDHASVF